MVSKPVSEQSTDEWLEALSGKAPKSPVRVSFDHHRTTRQGSLVLAFRAVPEDGREYVVFFNVDVHRQRGAAKGAPYRTGAGGQFLSRKRSKFRKFWMSVVGIEPRRWSEAHHELWKLATLDLVADRGFDSHYDQDGEQFFKLSGLPRLSAKYRQCVDSGSTSDRQASSTSIPVNPSNDTGLGGIQVHSSKSAQKHLNTVAQVHRELSSSVPFFPLCPKCSGEGCDWCPFWLQQQRELWLQKQVDKRPTES